MMQQSTRNFGSFMTELFGYIVQTKHVDEDKIEVLKNLKIAFSGTYILQQIYDDPCKLNPFRGYSNERLCKYLRTLKEVCNKYDIVPLVVLDGILYSSSNRYSFDEKVNLMKETWTKIFQGNFDEKLSSNMRSILEDNLGEEELISVLEELDFEYVRAPYNSIFQIKWFCDYHYAHVACCGLEGFLYGLNNIIVHFDLAKETFHSVDLKKLSKDMKFDSARVQSLFLVGGFNPITHRGVWYSKFREILAKGPEAVEVQADSSFEKVRKALEDNTPPIKLLDEELTKDYHAQRRKLDCVLVLSSECDVDLLQKQAIEHVRPNFGPYLPSDLYLMMVFNAISKELVELICNQKIVVKVPLAESAEFHYFIDKRVKLLLESILGSVIEKLHSSFKKKDDYHFLRYYFPDNKAKLTPKPFTLSSVTFSDARLRRYFEEKPTFCGMLRAFADFLNEEREKNNPTTSVRKESVDVSQLISSSLGEPRSSNGAGSPEKDPKSATSKSDTPLAQEKSTEQSADKKAKENAVETPKTENEFIGYVYLSFLENLEFLQSESKTFMVLGAALRKCDPTNEESLLILLELMRMGECLINGTEFNNSRVRKNSTEHPLELPDKKQHQNKDFYEINMLSYELSNEQREYIVLISRVFSLINPVESTNVNSDELDYDLSQYLSILNLIQTTLRLSFESIMVQSYYTFHEKRNLSAILRFTSPFRRTFSVGLGIAMKKLLQSKENLKEFKAKNSHLSDLENDIKKGYALWKSIMTLLEYQKSRNHYNSQLNQIFTNANKFLVSKLKDLKII